MQHFRHIHDVTLTQPSIVTVGVFDGVHQGHQTLLGHLAKQAHDVGKLAVVLSFFPHPDVVLHGMEGRYYLTTPERRAQLLGELGIDVVVTHPFNEETRQMRAAVFVDNLLEYLNMTTLWATPDFALGYQREGNIEFLMLQGKTKGFRVETIDLVTDPEAKETVRSARIRAALATGDARTAMALLGRPYMVEGEVVKGDQRGRTIGFPTANVAVWEQQLLPMNGVYACRVQLGDEVFDAVTNVGQRPTFDGKTVTVETHLLNFDRDIYGEHLQVEFIERLRGEIKFSGIDALVEQIRQDIVAGRHVLATL